MICGKHFYVTMKIMAVWLKPVNFCKYSFGMADWSTSIIVLVSLLSAAEQYHREVITRFQFACFIGIILLLMYVVACVHI